MGLRGPGAKPIGLTPIVKRPRGRPRKNPLPQQQQDRIKGIIQFIESLPITSGFLAGQNFRVRDWQRQIIEGIYKTNGNNHRIVRQALISTPRKNGKTGLSAALALVHLCGPEAERRGQVYSAAADRHQAALIYEEMKAMIKATPSLNDRIIVRDFTKHLEDTVTGSIYMALSSDAKTKHGFSASCIIYDELAQAPDRKLYDVLQTSTGGRREPLTLVISTQSSDPHSIMTELVDYGIKIHDGILKDDSFYPVIYTAPEEADPWDEQVWYQCNPALNDFRSLEEMQVAALQAQRIPAREAAFRLLYLNQRVAAESRFIAKRDWDSCAGSINADDLRDRPCYGGLDLGSTTDLTSLVLFFPEDEGAVIPFFWAPEEQLDKREHEDKVPYRLWHKQGFLEAPEGRAMNKLAIINRIADIAALYDVRGIAYDRWHLEDLKKLLSDEGIEIPLLPWGQGFKDMAPAVDSLEVAILNQQIKHPNHPVLNWNISNAVVEMDPSGARKPTKDKSLERIDGLVALTMAVGLASVSDRTESESIYNNPNEPVWL